jgi:hypothetical protein
LDRGLQPLHRGNGISFDSFDVVLSRRLHAAVAKDCLDRLVVYTQPMEVGRQSAPERVPPAPLQITSVKGRDN